MRRQATIHAHVERTICAPWGLHGGKDALANQIFVSHNRRRGGDLSDGQNQAHRNRQRRQLHDRNRRWRRILESRSSARRRKCWSMSVRVTFPSKRRGATMAWRSGKTDGGLSSTARRPRSCGAIKEENRIRRFGRKESSAAQPQPNRRMAAKNAKGAKKNRES